MNSQTKPPLDEDVDALLWSMSVELRTLLAFSRATMQGVASISPAAAQAIDQVLARESKIVAVDDLVRQSSVTSLVEDARRRLKAAS